MLALRADSHALRIGELRIPAMHSEVIEALDGPAALIFRSGQACVRVFGRDRSMREGDVEVVCLGDTCTISAVQEVHLYVVVAKGAPLE